MIVTTRERLVEAAARLLREHPYHSVGVQALCDSAGVRKGSFYHFFESKEELTVAAIDQAWEAYKRGLADLDLATRSREERLRSIMDNCLASPLVHSLTGDRMVGCPFGRLAASITEHEPVLRQRLSGIFEEWIRLISEIVDGDVAVAWSTLAEIQGQLLLRATMDPVAVP